PTWPACRLCPCPAVWMRTGCPSGCRSSARPLARNGCCGPPTPTSSWPGPGVRGASGGPAGRWPAMCGKTVQEYEIVIGLEIHAELLTKSKVFCGCGTAFGADPNTLVCPVCLGLPGSLPVLNRQAVEFAIKAGLALNCEIAPWTKFDRKQYFYPDLPKAYQISQYDVPLCRNGWVEFEINGQLRRVGINRVHLEEEAGKSVHSGERLLGSEYSLVDYNRGGIPLIEIVTED